jgi:hypothetical protein
MAKQPEKHMTYYNIIDSFREKGCPVCYLVDKSVNSFFNSFLFENVLDYGIGVKLKKSRGFCKEHAFKLIKYGDSLATAITYSSLIEDLLDELNKMSSAKSNIFNQKGICPVCEVVSESEERYLNAFILYAKEDIFLEEYKKSKGMCVPHLKQLLLKCRDKKLLNKLIEIHIQFYKTLNEELKEIIRKNDYRFSKEQWGEEKDAWIRAVEKFVGCHYKDDIK